MSVSACQLEFLSNASHYDNKSGTGILQDVKKKTLTAGKDIKAQQFGVRLGKDADSVKTVTLGFTKSNELFVGRIAMLGFAFELIGEVGLNDTILNS